MPAETGSASTAPAPAQPPLPLPLPLPQRHLLQGALILCWSRRTAKGQKHRWCGEGGCGSGSGGGAGEGGNGSGGAVMVVEEAEGARFN